MRKVKAMTLRLSWILSTMMKVRRFCYQELILIIASYFPIIWLRFFIII